MSQINVDLENERHGCTFNIQEMTEFIDGGPQKTKQRKESEKLVIGLIEGTPDEYLSHAEKYEAAVKKSVTLFGLLRRVQSEGNLNLTDYREIIASVLNSSMSNDGSPLSVHVLLFVPLLLSQANDEQRAEWLPRAWNCNIIGTYAQTELGHGTFIRGLETTATFDQETKEFVLHSPALSSYKWWAGGMGHTANYCIIMAQLYTKGECHGIHPFIVQLRDEGTHMPLPGIKIGEIGAKMGLNAVNNGFLGLDHVRIPRTHMLMKNAQVLEDGTYVKSRNSKLNYGGMVFVRVLITYDMANCLSKVVTIAIRYSAVRRQGQLKEGDPECQILDFVTQQHKIFISIAAAHALRITANKLWETFNEVNKQLAGGNLDQLGEVEKHPPLKMKTLASPDHSRPRSMQLDLNVKLHALACCLKAVSSSDAACFIERCRLACGGHGYMHSSNLPLNYCQVTAACTYEGDNTVLLLQTARFLVKTWQQIDGKDPTSTVAYLKETRSKTFPWQWENSIQGIIRGFQMVAMRKVSSCVENMNKRVQSGMSIEDAWNSTSVQLVALAEVHCRVIIMSSFYEEVTKRTVTSSLPVREVLQQLVELYVVYWALEKLNDLLRYTSISKQDIDHLQTRYEDLLNKIRPNAVGLVDSFDISDKILNSTLGAYDGRVYERLMEEALKCPLNAEPVNQSFHKYIKPLMQGKL